MGWAFRILFWSTGNDGSQGSASSHYKDSVKSRFIIMASHISKDDVNSVNNKNKNIGVIYPMRKSALCLAVTLALFCSVSSAEDSPEKAMAEGRYDPPYNMEELTEQDRATARAKRSALTGYLHEEAALKELRELLKENEKKKKVDEITAVDLQPEDIIEYRKKMAELDRAGSEAIFGDADFRIRNISYDPDSNKPIVVSVAPGWSSQIEFYDSSGRPWPIKEEGIIGDSESFTKHILGEDSHIASFVLKRNYRKSNAAIILDGMSASIPILLSGDNTVVDGKLTVTLPRMGPNASIMPVYQTELNNVSSELVGMQGGNAPPNSKPLSVPQIPNSEAWYDGEFLYLSLPGRLLLPHSKNNSMSPTGRYLYKIDPSPFITVSVNGQRMASPIEGLYQADIRRAKTVFEKER